MQKIFRFISGIGACLLCLALAGCGASSSTNVEAQAYDIDGNLLQLQLYDNHTQFIVLNYWASWCKPCWQEMPALNAFYHANISNHTVKIFSVNYGEKLTPAQMTQKIAQMNIRLPTLAAEPKEIAGIKLPVPQGLPSTYVINLQNEEIVVLSGPQTQETLQKLVTTP